MFEMPNLNSELFLTAEGYLLVPGVLSPCECDDLIAGLGPISRPGRRALLAEAAVSRWARSTRLLELIAPHLPAPPIPVRSIFFDKKPGVNWSVGWHQDVTLALAERVDLPGFGPWSIKEGVVHVQPPVELLERMLTVRLHLDPTDASNGALRVMPGTHALGRLTGAEVRKVTREKDSVLCCAGRGDLLLMRPLLLHSSQRSTSSASRRVLHLEYAGFSLPSPLAWSETPLGSGG